MTKNASFMRDDNFINGLFGKTNRNKLTQIEFTYGIKYGWYFFMRNEIPENYFENNLQNNEKIIC